MTVSRVPATATLAALLTALLASLLATASPAATAENAPAGWTPQLSMRYRSVQRTAISPDGALVAFEVREPIMDEEHSEYRSQIWVGAGDGSWSRQFTWAESSSRSPAFSPDGRSLAFLSERDGEHAQIWSMPVDGGEPRVLTDAPAAPAAFLFLPDGNGIVYLMTDAETEEEKKQAKAKTDVILVDQQYKYAHLYKVDFDPARTETAASTQLTEGNFHITDFDIAADSARVVFRHQPDPTLNTGMIAGDLSIVDIASRQVQALVSWSGNDSGPLFSPDGRWVAFTSHGGSIEAVGLADVFVVPSAGGDPRRLASTPDRNASLLAWRADRILATESVGTTRQLLAVPIEGEVELLGPDDGVLGSPSLSRDGTTVAFTYQAPEIPADVYTADLASSDLGDRRRRISDLHADIDSPPMGRTEVLRWRSSDGREIEGLLTLPVGYQPGERVPLVLNIHGGPAGVFSRSFTGAPAAYMLQTFAQEGYAILRPNPRGSTGYGKEFRYANVRDWGFGDYQDVMAGVDHVIERGVADPDRLFVMGWSYGGYMTSAIIVRTGRFRAASMGAGLPNLVSMVHTSDIPDYLVAHMGAELWEDYEVYQRHSALFRIDKVTIPTQIVHGAQDLRVPFDQGRELYVALRRRGVPTEMVVYPRTPHGPREPKFVIDVTPRILDWFARHDRSGGVTADAPTAPKP